MQQCLFRADGAHANHKEDVEDGTADDSSESNGALGEGADEGGEQLRRGAARGHEGRARDIV